MEAAEEFLRDYLRSRTKLVREQWALHEPHVRRFFALNYEPWDRDKAIAGVESETIETVSNSSGTAEIVTTSEHFGLTQRTRYWLSITDSAWKITGMESACFLCHGSGKDGRSPCKVCDGKGWSFIGEKKPPNVSLVRAAQPER